MADFKFPDAWLPDRESGTNDVGSTLLGGASSLAPRWDYLRTTPQAEEGSYAGRRGIAPNVEPLPGSPESREAQAALAALQAVLPQTKAAAAATVLTAAGESAWSSGRFAPIAARLAPLAAAVAPAALVAVPFVAAPKIVPGDETIPLGDDLRARRPIGQRRVIFERRVDGGLFGTGIGAKWEELPPVDATFGDGLPGRRPVLVDTDQLRGAIGTETADRLLAKGGVVDRRIAANDDHTNQMRTSPGVQDGRLPPPLSSASEMRIAVSINGGEKTDVREATLEEIQRVCPSYAEHLRMGTTILDNLKAEGWTKGPERGTRAHKILEYNLKMQKDIEASLQARGIVERHPEIALRDGQPRSYSKGYRRLDILELYRDYATVCVFDLKTGDATVDWATAVDYLRNANILAKAKGFGYPNVYFIPIHVR